MKRRSFFGWLAGVPVAVGATAIRMAWADDGHIAFVDLGPNPFPQARRLPVDCDLTVASTIDALTYLPSAWDGNADLIFGRVYLDCDYAKIVRDELPNVKLRMICNTNSAWDYYGWVINWRGHVIGSPGG